MFRELEILATSLGLSQGQILAVAREIVGNDLRTIDLLTKDERAVLLVELKRMFEPACV